MSTEARRKNIDVPGGGYSTYKSERDGRLPPDTVLSIRLWALSVLLHGFLTPSVDPVIPDRRSRRRPTLLKSAATLINPLIGLAGVLMSVLAASRGHRIAC